MEDKDKGYQLRDVRYQQFLELQKVHPVKSFKNPKNYAGIWFSIHILAKEAKTREQKLINGQAIITIMTHMGCEMCVEHIKAWLLRHPIQHTFNGDEYALFDWTAEAHNYASSNAGNPVMTKEDARVMWYSTEGCSENSCHGKFIMPTRITHPKIRS